MTRGIGDVGTTVRDREGVREMRKHRRDAAVVGEKDQIRQVVGARQVEPQPVGVLRQQGRVQTFFL